MSTASHAVARLRELYGIVLGRMRFLNERSMHPPLDRSESAPPAILEQLEPRLLLSAGPEEQALELFSVSPALFVENQGQWADASIRYAYEGDGVGVAFTDTGAVLRLMRPVSDPTADEAVGEAAAKTPIIRTAVAARALSGYRIVRIQGCRGAA